MHERKAEASFDCHAKEIVHVVHTPDQSLLMLACALDPLTVAREHHGFDLQVSTPTLTKFPSIAAQSGDDKMILLFIVSSEDITESEEAALTSILASAAKQQVPVILTGAAIRIAAEQRLLDGHAVALHWQIGVPTWVTKARLDVKHQIFCKSGLYYTCPGGTALLDLTLEVIRQYFGDPAHERVCRKLQINVTRRPQDIQAGKLRAEKQYLPYKVGRAIEIMQQRLSPTLPLCDICQILGVSQRQLERLFVRYVQDSPRSYYRKVQLNEARWLCENTDLNLTEIAKACGFGGSSTLSSRYRKAFGITPTRQRELQYLGASSVGPEDC
ncbi:GlxA family transcriptional regulator [Thalassococcus sp. S3]|uniref:GlxA family transcriptional regulator n=1 Tax=Thalassococcus sp. S3 TaxID=2017482 RepID=UPI00102429D8|nr:helix-turn-helix domain-containing protein [Thalassococcus sp. S3]QBF33320.1 hypothetical protein CFI11_19155 [Thalassococcus sp. S3]